MAAGCIVSLSDGSEEDYDGCILATHAPDSLKLLGQEATHDERTIHGAFQYANRYHSLFEDWFDLS